MVKSTHTSFPEEGVDVRVSVDDAARHGIKCGEYASVDRSGVTDLAVDSLTEQID